MSVFFNDGTIREEPPLSADEQYPLRKTSQYLVDVILGRAEVLVSGDLGLFTVEFLAAARESAQSGQIVPLPIADGTG